MYVYNAGGRYAGRAGRGTDNDREAPSKRAETNGHVDGAQAKVSDEALLQTLLRHTASR